MNTHSRSFHMHGLKMILAASTLIAMSLTVLAADVVNIADYGVDGDTHYYQVACSDNRKGSVAVKDKPAEICARRRDGGPICRANWTVKKAAFEICK